MEDGPQQCNFDGNHDVNDDDNDDDGDGFDDGYDDDGGCSDNGYVNVADEKGAYQVEGRTTPQILFGHVKSCDKECPIVLGYDLFTVGDLIAGGYKEYALTSLSKLS